MTTTDTSITQDLTPAEAARLLTALEEGNQAAWLATRELSWDSPDYPSRFQTAAEIDSLVQDVMRETIQAGLRRPGEPIAEFAERVGADALLAETLTGTGTAAQPRQPGKRDPQHHPDRTPGTPHPDPFLAARGWHVNEHGIYTRHCQPEPPQPEPRPANELEAG